MDIKATNNYVVLKLEKVIEQEKTPSGILLVKNDEKYNAFIHSIGPDAKLKGFELGNNVIFNEYDKKVVEIDKQIYVIVKDISVMAVVDK